MLRIEAPHFVVGAIVQNDRCVRVPPIVAWMRGKPRHVILAWCARRGYRVSEGSCEMSAGEWALVEMRAGALVDRDRQ